MQLLDSFPRVIQILWRSYPITRPVLSKLLNPRIQGTFRNIVSCTQGDDRVSFYELVDYCFLLCYGFVLWHKISFTAKITEEHVKVQAEAR